MTYEPRTDRRVLLLRPAKYAKGDGYGAFGPDGDRLVEYWRKHGAVTQVREIDVTAPDDHDPATPPSKGEMKTRFARTLAVLRGFSGDMPKDTLVIAAHGWRTGLQLGITTKNVGQFADALIAAGLTVDADIFLAACSAGDGAPTGDKSVADELRDALAVRGHNWVTVYAHTTAGEAFRNPFVRVFTTGGQKTPITGGTYLVAPKSRAFVPWRKAMGRKTPGPGGFLWCRFFDMGNDEIAAEIST